MEEAGLQVREDGAGNVIGRLEGVADGPAVLSGSHVDSVPNGGNFDGPLGVIAALEVAEAWRETGHQPERPYEVIVFSDEEGSRFGSGLTGSHAMAGELTDERMASVRDMNGQTFAEVMDTYGTSVMGVKSAARNLRGVGLFVELHIEQGKKLERAGLAVGAVKGIAGPVWMDVTFEGTAGHAGNTPMDDRRDPLVAASHFVHVVSSLPRKFSETAVATVGRLTVSPNGINVIPQKVELTVDVRDIQEDKRTRLVEAIVGAAQVSANMHHADVTTRQTLSVDPLLVQEDLLADMNEAIEELGMTPMDLVSGAGHDAMVIGRKVPAAMLFVRSENGISHNPAEWTDLNDCVKGIHVLKAFIEKRMGE